MKIIKTKVSDMEMWTLGQGSRRHVTVTVHGDLVAYQKIYFGTAESLAHIARRRRRTWYGRITSQSETEIEFEPLKAGDFGVTSEARDRLVEATSGEETSV